MACDMLVTLTRATRDGSTLFAHNCNRAWGTRVGLLRVQGHDFTPGDCYLAGDLALPQPRHALTVLAGTAQQGRGYLFGVNEKGVALGCTRIHSRLEDRASGLSGPDLVRLGLERSTSACQAVEVLTDLIGRHGLGSETVASEEGDSAFLVADHKEAHLIEAAGRHWVLAHVGSVRAVTGESLLHQDWDRISRGLSDLAIERGWYPSDGCKLDFAEAVARPGPDRSACLRRWGQATLRLEQHSGRIEPCLIRQVLRDLAANTVSSWLVRVGPSPEDLPVAWFAPGSPGHTVYLPVFLAGELPVDLVDNGSGCSLAEALASTSREDLLAELEWTQQQIDEQLHEFLPEASALYRAGQHDPLRHLTGSFMKHCCERVRDALGEQQLALAQTGTQTYEPVWGDF